MLKPADPDAEPARSKPRFEITPWSWPEALGSLCMSFVLAFIGSGVVLALDRNLYRHHSLLFGSLTYQFFVAGTALSAIVFILIRFHARPSVLGWRYRGWRSLLFPPLTVLVAIYGATALLYAVFRAFLPAYHLSGNSKALFPHAPNLPWWATLGLFLWLCVETPLAEETLFRGIIYQGLRTFLNRHVPLSWAIGVAAGLSGLVFGLSHGEIHTLPLLILAGVGLALAFEWTGSLYTSSIVHGLINLGAVVQVLAHR